MIVNLKGKCTVFISDDLWIIERGLCLYQKGDYRIIRRINLFEVIAYDKNV
jgi:hypothetical protein